MRHITAVGFLLVAIVLPAWGCGREDSRVATTQLPVHGGTIAGPLFGEVVALVQLNDDEPFCSGMLITPYWVLTAAHCFGPNSPVHTGDDFDILVGPDPATAEQFRHSLFESGAVANRIANPDPLDDEDVALDIAVFRLNERVPRALAKPHHISLTPNVCPSGNFLGTVVGYGENLAALDAFDFANNCPDPAGFPRRFGISNGWERSVEDTGSVYRNHWFIGLDPCVYNGSTFGDSGGPLFDSSNRICGVNSALIPEPLPFGFEIVNSNSGVDSPENIDYLVNIAKAIPSPPIIGVGILDPRGNFDCEPCDRAPEHGRS